MQKSTLPSLFARVAIGTNDYNAAHVVQAGTMEGKKSGLVSTALRTVSIATEKELQTALSSIQKKCDQKRAELYEIITEDIVEFKQQADSTSAVRHQLKEVQNEFERLDEKIKNDVRGKLLGSSGKKQEIEAKLLETEKLIQFLTGLYSVYETFTSSWKDLEVENYSNAASKIRKALTAIGEINEEGKNAQIYISLQRELSQRHDKLKKVLNDKWHTIFVWKPKRITADTNTLHLSLTVMKNQILQVSEAMKELNIWERMVHSFVKQLLAAFCSPFVSLQDRLIIVEEGEEAISVCFKQHTSPCTISEIFSCLLNLFQFVEGIISDDGWLSGIQKVMEEILPNLLIEKCLSNSVPSTVEELSSYDQVISLTEEFEKTLVKMKFLSPDFDQLSKYVKNINVHFSKKQVEDILVQARNILSQPLHDTKLMKHEDVLENLETIGAAPVQTVDSLVEIFNGEELDAKFFHFPTCHVSETVVQFVNLLYSTLLKCAQSSGSAAIELFHTCRDILDLYCAIVPSCHKTVIAEIPRVAAIHHNNCLYVSHHLLTLGHQFQCKLPPPLNSGTTTFVDFIPKLQQIGEETFLAELRKQRDITVKPLKSTGSFDNVSYEERQSKVEKCLEQSLLHVAQVSSVYQEVLPLYVYAKSTGALLDSLTVCFIEKVTCLEDISAEDSTVLHSFIQHMLHKMEMILQVKKSIHSIDPSEVCNHFVKLQELGFVLSASLVDIVNSWQNGKLSKQFTPLELRSLIKAVFQNTDHRAKLLAKITA